MSAELPVLVVGDVHGDFERFNKVIAAYPASGWRTICLGDAVDLGPFGIGVLRYLRDRANTELILGNHEIAMLAALRDEEWKVNWIQIGGQPHDLEELKRDPDLEAWLRERPALVPLPDGTLAQHCGHDLLKRLLPEPTDPTPVDTINKECARLLQSGGEATLWEILSAADLFRMYPRRLEDWLYLTGSERVIHGHTPHLAKGPDAYHGGRAISFDGGFSRFGGRRYRKRSPDTATIAPLPPIPHMF